MRLRTKILGAGLAAAALGMTLATPAQAVITKPSVVTVTGTVSSGVEHGCRLLSGYLLLGGDSALLQPGATVRVTGVVRPDVMTFCQQGTPLSVQEVTPVSGPVPGPAPDPSTI